MQIAARLKSRWNFAPKLREAPANDELRFAIVLIRLSYRCRCFSTTAESAHQLSVDMASINRDDVQILLLDVSGDSAWYIRSFRVHIRKSRSVGRRAGRAHDDRNRNLLCVCAALDRHRFNLATQARRK